MASITSAQSGPSNVGSTWTGGVVPGTTFAGTRTTTAAGFAIGATTIALQAGSPAVTAGKWIKFAGHSTYHRVTTGLGTGAGNIVLTQGLEEAIPASATVVSVDMVDDKVTIAHPGTNNASSTAYLLNGARSAGDVAITVDTGTGTILAGECIQFEHQIGTDEDGQPIYDNTYYPVTVALTAGVITIASPGLAYAMADNVRVVNRGHVVELVANHVWGDDTSSQTAANNGIVVSGTLKAGRSVSQTLVCRGTMYNAARGTFDFGASGDAIPAGVTATIKYNDSLTLAVGKHVFTSYTDSDRCTWRIRGVVKKRNSALSGSVGAGGGAISVADSTGWAAGDRVVIESDTLNAARAQVVTIGGAAPNWSVSPAVTNSRAAGSLVGNLSSNVQILSLSPSFPAGAAFGLSDAAAFYGFDVGDCRFENCTSNVGWSLINRPMMSGVALSPTSTNFETRIKRAAIEMSSSAGNGFMIHERLSKYRSFFVECAAYASITVGNAHYFGDGAFGRVVDCVTYRCNIGTVSTYGAGAYNVEVVNTVVRATSSLFNPSSGRYEVSGGSYWASGAASTPNSGSVKVSGADIQVGSRFFSYQPNSGSTAELVGCDVSAAAIAGNETVGSTPSQASIAKFTAINNDPDDNRVLSYYQTTVTDLTTRRRSTYAVKIQPKVASTAITYVFTIPAISGVAQVIKGSLRFDATYGTTTPPSITLSGQGVSQSFTCAATADAWDDFSFSFTPTSTGDITATVTVQSASTSGFAWLDGVWHYPMIQAVRHWGYQWLPQAAQLVDSRMMLTEAAALALPVAVDHTAQTITVTGMVSPSEALQAQLVDLVQTANNARAVHCAGDGSSFATTYTVVLSGAGAITGPYTDAAGPHIKITSSALIAGTLVQLYDTTAAAELYVGTPTGAIDYATIYAGDKPVRVRAMQCGTASATRFLEQLGTLGSSGLAYLLTQEADTVYAANAIDGAGVTGLAIVDGLMLFELAGRSTISWGEIYAYECHWLATVAGIRDDGRIIEAVDTANYKFHGFRLKNLGPTALTITGGWGRDATTGRTADIIDTSGFPIFTSPDAVVPFGTGGASPAEIADKVLGRNLAGSVDGGRTVRDALRLSRNRWNVDAAGTLTVYAEDDATVAWTASTEKRTADSQRVVGVDPA